jgi:glucose/arabinose dehydrogenase
MRVPAVVLVLLLAACAQPRGGSAASEPALTVPEGLTAEPVVDGLAGPTQMVFGPDGRLWVAQLNGGENERRGQVVAVDLPSGEREVVIDGLDKPTGIAWLDGDLWIATRDALLRAAGGSEATEPVLDGLPNNGRSNGTLTPTPGGTLLYETSGRERRGGSVEGSGTLWELDPGQPDGFRPVATGLKNAYAHVYDTDGALWTTEIAEPIGGSAAPDELNRIERGADYGWPACVGDRRPVAAFGGDLERCRGTVAPVAEFGPGATATSIVVNPFAVGELVVALWNAGEVVAVAADGSGRPRPMIGGLTRPQHLLVDDGALFASDHERGTIYRVTTANERKATP